LRRFPEPKVNFGLLLARLACLIHAANVHSEPGSNPSINVYLTGNAPVTDTQLSGRSRLAQV
jgi:hypothetical protein